MPKVSFSSRKIEIKMNASDWQLYSSMEGVHDAAVKISEGVQNAINESTTRKEAEPKVYKVLNTYSNFGAADTEGYNIAAELLDGAFDSEVQHEKYRE